MERKEFEILHWIEYMNYNNPKQLSKQMEISEQEAEDKLRELADKDLIKIEFRNNQIYGSQLTEKGKAILEENGYGKWKEELGF